MKNKIKTVLAAMVIIAVTAGSAFAMGDCGRQGQRRECSGKESRMMSDLQLSPEQRALLDKKRASHKEAMMALRTELKAKKEELRKAISVSGSTKYDVTPILDRIKKLQSDMADKRVEGIFAVKHILSPEQFAKLQSMQESGTRRWHKGRG